MKFYLTKRTKFQLILTFFLIIIIIIWLRVKGYNEGYKRNNEARSLVMKLSLKMQFKQT